MNCAEGPRYIYIGRRGAWVYFLPVDQERLPLFWWARTRAVMRELDDMGDRNDPEQKRTTAMTSHDTTRDSGLFRVEAKQSTSGELNIRHARINVE